MLSLYPGKQIRTEVETVMDIIIHALDHSVMLINNDCLGIRFITFLKNALVPVVKRRCRRLNLYFTGPRVFTRRLVKMTVKAKKSFQFCD